MLYCFRVRGCREGLSTRPVAGSDEIQLRIDPIHADLDDEITGLRSQVKLLRNVNFLFLSPSHPPLDECVSRFCINSLDRDE